METPLYEWGSREKPTLLCLHGMGSSGLSFGEFAHFLTDQFHVLAVDLPGHGKNQYGEEDEAFLPSRLAKRIRKTIDSAGKPIYLAGHSWGAHITLYAAHAYPELLKGMILLDGGYLQQTDLPEGGSLQKELENAEAFYEAVRFPSWDSFIESEKAEWPRWSEELEVASKAQVKEKDGEIRLAAEPPAIRAVLKGVYAEPITEGLSDMKIPLLLLRSTLPVDLEGIRQTASARLQTEVPEATVHAVKDTTHDIYRDAPKETAEYIKKWVRQLES
ncbi:MAG TPA: alpha/beta fold hydrolase [Bacillales bacterium]|nr:alpha/beta fold hydrolase [Bacillales bacterium]